MIHEDILEFGWVTLIYREVLTEEDVLALQNEIEVMIHVDHPNIVKLHDVFEDSENYFIVMELMTGGEVIQCPLDILLLAIWQDYREILFYWARSIRHYKANYWCNIILSLSQYYPQRH